MKKTILSLILLLLFSGCTKWTSICPKISVCDKPLTLHINKYGGLDANDTKAIITRYKTCKRTVQEYNRRFANDSSK